MNQLIRLSAALIGWLAAGSALCQQTPVGGTFTADAPCEATKKLDRDNPGNVRVKIQQAYPVIARNGTPGSHYQIRVPGAPATEARWVPMECGTLTPAASGTPHGTITPGSAPKPVGPAPDSTELILAASWQPAFCASAAGRGKRECRTQTARRYDATHFSLHGLWPDDLDDAEQFPCYCDRGGPISCRASQEPDSRIDLAPAIMKRLEVAMPGVQSGLQRHEWAKHGSCYEDDKTGSDAGADPNEYFSEALAVLDALNASQVRQLFADHLGEVLTNAQIAKAIDTSFGRGAAKRVQVRCSRVAGENVISELWISLKGDIAQPADLGELIQAAPTARSGTNKSCASGRVLSAAR